jgi:hypothetical protein
MLAKVFDMEESKQYDDLTDEKLDHFLANPHIMELTSTNLRKFTYHTSK